VRPRAELGVAPPLRHGVDPAQRLPVGGIRTGSHRQRRQVPDVRRQSQVSVADNDPIDVHRHVIIGKADSQHGIGGNRNFYDCVEKGTGEGPGRMDIHFMHWLAVDRNADRAHFHRRVANRKFAGTRQAGELDALAGVGQTDQKTT
jgi:hypothetical protein